MENEELREPVHSSLFTRGRGQRRQSPPHGTGTGAVVRSLLELIVNGRLAPGDRLPPEPELAKYCGVSRPTVRQALKALESAGLLSSRPRRGTILCASSPEMLAPLFSAHLSLAEVSIIQVAEARAVLEMGLVRLATGRRTDDDLAEMREALNDEQKANGDLDAHTCADLRFHAAILEAAHNPVVSALQSLLVSYFEKLVQRENQHVLPEAEVARILREHQSLYEAIREQDGGKAVGLMQQHMDTLPKA